MFQRLFLVFSLVGGIINITGAMGNIESGASTNLITNQMFLSNDEKAANEYNDSYKKWMEKNIKNYIMTIKYKAFSPLAGVWEITVQNNKPVKAVLNGKLYNGKSALSKLTMNRLFDMIAANYNDTNSSLAYLSVNYDEIDSFVRNISFMVKQGTQNSPKDLNQVYEVVDLKVE